MCPSRVGDGEYGAPGEGLVDARIRELVEMRDDLIWECDLEGRFTHLSGAWEAALGHRVGEMLGRPLTDFQPSAMVRRTAELLRELSTGAVVRRRDLTLLARSGAEVRIVFAAKASRDAQGRLVGSHGLGREERLTTGEGLEGRVRFLETLVNLDPDILYIYDLVERRNVYINDSAHAVLGYTSREMADLGGSVLAVLMHPDDLAAYRENTIPRYATARDGEPIHQDFRMRHRDGTWRWLRSTELLYARNDDGTPRQVFGTAHDISAEKKAVSSLLESEAKFRDIARNVPGVVYQFRLRKDGTSYFSYVSPRATELLGLPIDPDRPEWELGAQIPEEERDAFVASVGAAVGAGLPWRYEGRIRAVDGTIKWFHGTSLPMQLGDELVYNGILSDITDRKHAEATIAAEKERLAVTLRSIGDAVVTLDTGGNVVELNQAAEALTGWSLDLARGASLDEVLTLRDERTREPRANLVRDVLRRGDVVDLEDQGVLVARDGSERVVSGRASPIRTAKGEILGVVLVVRDITEKRRIVERLQRTEKLESLGVLAGGIAHDFNNLLSGIFGYVTLARETVRAGEAAAFLDEALSTFERARALTKQLLTFAKGGAPSKKTCSLREVLRASTQFSLSGSSCDCCFEIADDLRPCDVDPNQIGQVIDNLVINARQAMPDGGTVLVRAENVVAAAESGGGAQKPGPLVHVSIGDTGVGIPAALLPRIFDPFFTTKEQGNGLGLATVHSIVTRHGGTISVESSPGRGTTFHVFLPASSSRAEEASAATGRARRGRGRVLVMDDEAELRDVARGLLSKLGYDAHAVGDGAGAVAAFSAAGARGEPFDLVILDLTIVGGMGGKDAVAALRALDAAIPIVVSSGYSNDAILADPRAHGFTDALRKPYTKGELAEVLARHLAR